MSRAIRYEDEVIHSNLKKSIPAGTSDVLGHDMRIQQHILGIIQNVYERFGFSPHDTPIIENDVVFEGHHGEGEKLIFRFSDKDSNPLVLRYDLTVPLARVVAMYEGLPRPYRRYQIGPVFRDESADGRHFRQFIQCDGDIVGCSSFLSDAEIITLAYTGLKSLGFSDFTIRINHRKIFQGIIAMHGINESRKVVEIQRAIDKSDKYTCEGMEGIKRDLRSYGIETPIINTLLDALKPFDSPTESLKYFKKIIVSDIGLRGIEEIEEIISYLSPEVIKKITIDMSLARGADYYTGFILEGVINNVPVGAVLGGGRYDNLVNAFSDLAEPAVGMAFGFERILNVLNQTGILELIDAEHHKIMVASVDKQFSRRLFKVADWLRNQSFEVIMGYEPLSEDNQFNLAHQQHCAVLVTVTGIDNEIQIEPLPGFENSCIFSTLKGIFTEETFRYEE